MHGVAREQAAEALHKRKQKVCLEALARRRCTAARRYGLAVAGERPVQASVDSRYRKKMKWPLVEGVVQSAAVSCRCSTSRLNMDCHSLRALFRSMHGWNDSLWWAFF